jgi:hypothetical protein|tara:strand:- start:22 stop:150 length:129 start_codon:yes stop_codon:yes gene_type:complete
MIEKRGLYPYREIKSRQMFATHPPSFEMKLGKPRLKKVPPQQ